MEKETKTIEIKAKAKDCFDTISDYESYPQWQKEVESVVVLDKEDGRATVVEYTLDAIIKKINYTLSYSYEQPSENTYILSWDYVGGDLKNIIGKYVFEEVDGVTKATFSLSIEIGKWVPKMVLNKFREISMKNSMVALKDRVEKK